MISLTFQKHHTKTTKGMTGNENILLSGMQVCNFLIDILQYKCFISKIFVNIS